MNKLIASLLLVLVPALALAGYFDLTDTLAGKPVDASGLSNARIPRYNSGTGRWDIVDPAGIGAYTASAGVQLIGLDFSANLDGASLAVGPAGLRINAAWPGQASITTLGTIASGVWQGTAVGTSRGGTGTDSSSWTGLARLSGGLWSASPLADGDIPATITRDAEWTGLPFITSAASGSLSAERVIQGTADQIIADLSAPGLVTLSLPQSIATTSAVQFESVNVDGTMLLGSNGLSSDLTVGGFITLSNSDGDVPVVFVDKPGATYQTLFREAWALVDFVGPGATVYTQCDTITGCQNYLPTFMYGGAVLPYISDTTPPATAEDGQIRTWHDSTNDRSYVVFQSEGATKRIQASGFHTSLPPASWECPAAGAFTGCGGAPTERVNKVQVEACFVHTEETCGATSYAIPDSFPGGDLDVCAWVFSDVGNTGAVTWDFKYAFTGVGETTDKAKTSRTFSVSLDSTLLELNRNCTTISSIPAGPQRLQIEMCRDWDAAEDTEDNTVCFDDVTVTGRQ